MYDILKGKLEIKKLKEDFSYIEDIFGKESEIEFGDIVEIKKEENYFSLIIGKNGVGKSSFLNYLIHSFNANQKDDNTKLMYITFSAFDDIPREKKEEKNYIYNGLKSKAHGAVKTSIYNENKLKIINYLENDKISNFTNYINYLYFNSQSNHPKIVINISYISNIFFNDLDELDFSIDLKQQFLHIIQKHNINILPKYDMETVEQYGFYDSHNKNIDIFKISNILYLYIFNKLNKKIKLCNNINLKSIKDELNNIINLIDFESILQVAQEEQQMFNGERDFEYAYQELQKDIKYIKNSLNLTELFSKVNLIRKYNSGTQLIKISFGYKEDSNFSGELIFNYDENNNFSYNDFSYSSSGELVLLYTLLHLSDFKDLSCKKIILIDEPEISLHPQWQKDYFGKLNKGLEILGIKNCFFIIVTHSPLIVLGSQDSTFNEDNGELEKKYNTDIYGFKKEENINADTTITVSEKINYISLDSIDEILGDDFGVQIITTDRQKNISYGYNKLINDINEDDKEI